MPPLSPSKHSDGAARRNGLSYRRLVGLSNSGCRLLPMVLLLLLGASSARAQQESWHLHTVRNLPDNLFAQSRLGPEDMLLFIDETVLVFIELQPLDNFVLRHP